VAGIPSKFTDVDGMLRVLPPAVAWTAASLLRPSPAGTGPRSGRFRSAPDVLATGRLATSRMDGDTSNATALLNLG
jgi:hypothetical protein